MARRQYEQRLRAESAEQTRRRILDAFRERLGEGSSKPVSVEEIARRAGVARSTVYLIFGSRAGLFPALRDDVLLAGVGFELILSAGRQPDAREYLRGGLAGSVEMYMPHRELF